MLSESSIHVVVLSMNIAADSAAHGNEFGTGCNGQEPSFGHDHFEDLVQREAALAFGQSTLRIEGEYLIVPDGIDGFTGE